MNIAEQITVAVELAYLVGQLALLVAVTGAAVWGYFTFWR